MVLRHDLRTRMEVKIKEIEAAIEKTVPRGGQLSVMAGSSGLMLYYFYLARMQDSAPLYDHAFELLQRTLDFLEDTGADSLTYCNGLAGFGLLFQLLANEEFIETDVDDVMLALDDSVVAHTAALLRADNLDFLHGATGNGFYLISRIGVPAVDDCLAQLIEHLATTAVRDAQGVRWQDSPSAFNSFTSGTVNLSLSHGLSSKLIFLAHCIKANVKTAECTSLLCGGIQYLQNQAHPENPGNVYATLITAAGSYYPSNRLAWCYGDLCVATALLFAGKVTQNSVWVEQAFSIATRASERLTPENTAIVDAGFCHGTAGVAHIYNRLYHESHREHFRVTRDYWLEQTLAKAAFPTGLAGYKAYQQEQWVPDSSLLEGIAGIGLVLQSCLEQKVSNLSWDTLFLLNFHKMD